MATNESLQHAKEPEEPEGSRERQPLREVLNVHAYPEMAFQSYEMLKNNASKLKKDFLSDKFRNPILSYTNFGTPDELETKIDRLREAKHISSEYEDVLGPRGVGAMESSLTFREKEYRLVGLFAALNDAVEKNIPEEELSKLAAEARNLNETLYGTPNPEILNSSLGQIWQTIDSKELHASALPIYEQLREGFWWQDTFIEGLPKPEEHDKLPDFNHPSLAWAGDIIMDQTAHIESLIREVWDMKVQEFGDDYVASPHDIVEFFEYALQLMDPTGESGIKTEIDPNSSSLSWDSSRMVILVGDKRSPIKSAEALYQKFLHEGYVHGGRGINGLRTNLTVLGTGLFTETERADYLTFEEGLATTIEETVSRAEPKWDSPKLGHCINVWLASQGNDFRSVFEVAWRYRLLDQIENGQIIDDALIDKHKTAAYSACIRIFRGAPLQLTEKYPDIPPVTYNKDLAYLNGRYLAMNYLAKLFDNQDEAGLMRLLSAKFDPTIPEQNQLVDQFAA